MMWKSLQPIERGAILESSSGEILKFNFEISVITPRDLWKMSLTQTQEELDYPGGHTNQTTQPCVLKGEPCPIYLLIWYMLYDNYIDIPQEKKHITSNHEPWLF